MSFITWQRIFQYRIEIHNIKMLRFNFRIIYVISLEYLTTYNLFDVYIISIFLL